MVFAQFQPQNEAEAAGFFVGVMIAGVISGGIPFTVGLLMRQVGLGIGGGIVSAGAGALAGCCLGIPVAIVCTVIIVVVASMSNRVEPQSPFAEPLPSEYDDYARAFRVPGEGERRRGERRREDRRRDDRRDERPRQARPEPERGRAPDDDLQRRADEEFFREHGFRPRRRDADWDE